ncbi:MAG: LacI family DNA-binding transcriptional regulator [Anaerolineales bacterium]|nr:LacI family DNA-binding transcriptional regulator [Anaerolineales bacterium]
MTIRDVAAQASVSVATVSRYLNQKIRFLLKLRENCTE